MNEIEIRVTGRDDSGPAVASAERRFQGLKKVGVAAAAGLGAAGAGAGAAFATGLAANMNIEVANDKLAAQLGLTGKEAQKAGEVAGDVYAANWGGSIEEVNAAIKSVGDNLGDVGKMSKAELEGMTTSALALAQVFEVDVASSTQAAGALIKNGLAKDSTEAFDIITAGMQNGLNKSDDFLDTLNEYSPQFAKLGLSGKDVLGTLSQFLQAGARDTDVAADALKEFSIIAVNGSKTTVDGFQSIGLNAEDMAAQIGKGGDSAKAGLAKVVEGLQAIKDPVEQDRVGVELFGTTWEDTVKTILPNLDMTKTGIENVDGATKKMADTVGDNAQGKIDTIKRSFEQWTQDMAGSSSVLGTVVTGVSQFGGGAVALAGNLGMAALAMKGLTAAMLMNPVGIVVAAIAALAAGLIILWKRSETAREVMTLMFSGMAGAILQYVQIIVGAASNMSSGVLSAISLVMNALAKVPGPTQDNAKAAAASFDEFRAGVEGTFDSVERKLDGYSETVANLPKKIRLQADEEDLQEKLRHAQSSLRKLPANKRTVVQAEIDQAQRAIAHIQARLRGIPDRYVNVFVSEVSRDRATAARGRAHGGIIGAATGGLRGSWTMVGEAGRELVKLPFGSQVIGHGGTENMLKDIAGPSPVPGGGSGSRGATGPVSGREPVVIEFRSDGSRLGDLLLEITRKSIRDRGGDVQLVLGS